MKSVFTSQKIIEKLVTYYGLPAFLFQEISSHEFRVKINSTIKTVRLIPYSDFNLPPLPIHRTYFIFEDQWRTKSAIIASKIAWLAQYHEKIQARSCTVVKLQKNEAEHFHNQHHLMGYVQSAIHYALIHQKQLVAVASFSKGRKMHRLPEAYRSFELIRYSTIENTSITGGLSKLLRQFRHDQQPGDIMTYVDSLHGESNSYEKLGFIKSGRSKPNHVYVNTKTHQRFYRKPDGAENVKEFIVSGNEKLILNCID